MMKKITCGMAFIEMVGLVYARYEKKETEKLWKDE